VPPVLPIKPVTVPVQLMLLVLPDAGAFKVPL
jgi:hypothetical protein